MNKSFSDISSTIKYLPPGHDEESGDDDDPLLPQDLLQTPTRWPDQDCELQNGWEEDSGQNSVAVYLWQPDKTQGTELCLNVVFMILVGGIFNSVHLYQL